MNIHATPEGTEAAKADEVLYEAADGIAWVTVNRPRYQNAQTLRMIDQIDAALRRAVDDDDVKVIVLGASGKNFSSGHDMGTPDFDYYEPRERSDMWYDHSNKPAGQLVWAVESDAFLGMCRKWQAIPKPMIAMVQGGCVAGGLTLAWVCDMIVASDDAYFQDPVARMGVPGVEYFAHSFELPTRIAREFVMLGRRMSAERAYQFGMVNEIAPREGLREAVRAIAAELADRPSFGLTLTKHAFNVVEDIRGKRSGMDAVFGMHQLSHSHNAAVHNGSGIMNMDAKTMAIANKKQAGEG